MKALEDMDELMAEYDFIKWIGHASFMLDVGVTKIYIDPFRLSKDFGKADVIFITHSHFDHLSIDDIRKIAKDDTVILAPEDAAKKVSMWNAIAVKPYDKGEAKGVRYEAVRAYNVKPERLSYHPKDNNWLGYVIDVGDTKVYHAGDTDAVEEMKGLRTDIALLPMGGTYTMDVDEMAKAAGMINAKTIVPMHYKALLGKEGSAKAEEKIREKLDNIMIMKEIQEPYYSF